MKEPANIQALIINDQVFDQNIIGPKEISGFVENETCLLRTEIPQGNARILCHPICSGEGDLEAVVEFVRTHGNAFTEDEIEVASKH